MATLRLINNSPAIAAHEDLFLARYERLLDWALPLAEGNAAAAEDLVHDAFIQFTLAQPDLDAIENLDGYLRQMLRNLRVSQGRRAAQRREQTLCIADYDSAELSLRFEEMHAGLSARQELQLICQYALVRRQSSKAASVLLLRFFHGYLPAEIARLLRLDEAAGRGAVKQWLSLARREARQFLHEPQSLQFIGQPLSAQVTPLELPRNISEPDFLQALRATIFAAPQTQACLSASQWKARYHASLAEPLQTSLLAHLVCCGPCLGRVNALLGLAGLNERFPDDPRGSATASQGKGVSHSKRSRDALRAESRRRRAATQEHDPAELHICANGFLVATQTVEAARHHFSFKIHLDESLAFIEIFSEQGVRLLYLPVGDAPASTLKQTVHLEFNGQRTLDATLHFVSSWPTLEVKYEDVGARGADYGVAEDAAPQFLLEANLPSLFANIKSAFRHPQTAIRWLLRPVTITLLLTLVLLTIVVGQKLGWWLAPTPLNRVPVNTLPPRAIPAARALPNSMPDVAPSVETPAGKATVAPVLSPAVVSATATAALEIEVLRLLNAARADLNEQIEVRRTPQNRLRIDAILDTEARKAELLQALASVREHPAVELHLQTVAEALTRQSRGKKSAPSGSVSTSAGGVIEREEIAATTLPVDAELRRYLGGRNLTGAKLDAELRRYAAAIRAQSFKARSHATALKQLAARFTTEQLREVDATARAQWLGLLRNHAQQTRAAALALRQQIAPVFTASGNDGAETMTIRNDEELRRASERLAQLCAESDRIVQAAFTISSDAAPPEAIRTPGFWQRLHRIEHLAEAISTVQ